MQDILAVLDNREKAILIWAAVGLLFALSIRDVRSSLPSILRLLLSSSIVVVLGAMAVYVFLVVCGAFKLGFWDFSMTKDTAVWFLGPALVMVFNSSQANRDVNYFRKILLASLQAILVIEFLINLYVLPIYAELALVPVVFCLAALLAVAETKAEFLAVKRLLQWTLAALGLSLLGYTTARAIGDVHSFTSVDTLNLFLLPIALTVLFVPFLYSLAIYIGYEGIFVRIKIWITDNELAQYTRRQIFNACLFRLSRVNRFVNEYARKLPTIKSKSDAADLLSHFRREWQRSD